MFLVCVCIDFEGVAIHDRSTRVFHSEAKAEEYCAEMNKNAGPMAEFEVIYIPLGD